jgi:AhpC/TSA family protein
MQWQPLVLSDPPGPLRIAHSKSSAALRTFYSRDRRTDLENCTDTVTSWGKGYRTWIRFEGRTVKLFAAMFICASMLALLNNAQEKANKNSAANIGLAVGQKVPKFTARDQFGQEQSNETLKGSNGTVLLFFLSADWWPYCKAQLVQLQNAKPRFESQGVKLAAISYDSAAILKDFACFVARRS